MTLPFNAAQLVAARQEGGLLRTVHDIAIVTQRNLLLDLRNPAVIIGATGFPIFLMLIFTAGFAKVVVPGGSYTDYAQFLVPLSTIQGLLFSTINTGTSLYYDLQSGMVSRLRTLPIARSAVLAGRILGGAGRLLVQVVFIILVGHLIGFRFQNGFINGLIFLLLPVLFTSAFSWVAVFLAVKAESAETVQAAMAPWLLPLTFLSIGYVPKEGFPQWIQGFVEINPVSAVAQAMRGLASGGPFMGYLIQTLLWSAALTAVFSTLAIRAYQKRTS
jgi:ABC-2 type transport system permease protein